MKENEGAAEDRPEKQAALTEPLTEPDLLADSTGNMDSHVGFVEQAHPASASPRSLSPVDAVMQNYILFPNIDRSWFEKDEFDGVSGADLRVDDGDATSITWMIYATLVGFAVILILLGIIAYFAGMTPSPKPGKKPQLILCYYDPTLSSLSSFVLSDFCAQCCSHIVFDGFELDATKHIVSRQAPPPHPGVKLRTAIPTMISIS
ncbi:uncharacterized protein LOC8027793 [Ixodes scapularis]|uniref:uncharacterized protein LOC8027793 n=1 Tax=Ixodes scapularis TaxID=6945 RepID=UPI001C38C6CA|nr:uncharacterized protein LOC8027793 [Ixodes scapularis]